MQIVAKSFSPAAFADYVKTLALGSAGWKPEFVVRHNTGSPTLAMRPDGLTHQHILNLKSYYETLGWHAGPHAFVDDKQIWVFSSLLHPGVHTPSWNHVSFGVEQLGEFGSEDYAGGRGLAVQKNAVAAIAVLSHYAGLDSHSMRDHREDPETTHKDCPGSSCHDHKAAFMDAVHQYIAGVLLPAEAPAAEKTAEKTAEPGAEKPTEPEKSAEPAEGEQSGQ